MIKQVIVMRKDLNMRKGKMAAQAAHAAMLFLFPKQNQMILPSTTEEKYPVEFKTKITNKAAQWLEQSFTKIVVGVNSEEELDQIMEAAVKAGLDVYKCVDAGYTEFNGVPTATCLALGPDDSELIDSITGHLKLL